MTTTRGHHLIGSTLGSCVLERLIGYGGSSAVFLAQQHTPERKVAIKVFLPRSGMSLQMQRDFYRRFLHEAEAASQLDHPNILPIYGYGEQNGLPYIIMPYMAGGTLSEYIAHHELLSLEEASWFLEQIAVALDYAHAHGCIHCDIKPANMLLDVSRRIMLSDFGIAQMQTADDTMLQMGKTQKNAHESLMGTPDYISPEQALGEELTARSDIYSLGVTLFYMLAKQLPFKADTTIALALMHIHEEPPSLALLRMDITPEIERTIRKALSKRPQDRYETAQAFSTAFSTAVAAARNRSVENINEQDLPTLMSQVSLAQEEDISESILIASQPRVCIRSTAQIKRTHPLRWLLASACVLLLIGIISSGFIFSHLPLHTTHAGHPTQPGILSNRITAHIQSNQLADRQNWPTSSTFFFKQQHYYIINTSPQDVALALYANHTYSDFQLSVTMDELEGSHDGADYYGVVFRASNDQSQYYLFEIITSSNPQFIFWRHDHTGWEQLAEGALSVQTSSNNTITVKAQGNTFTFAVNGQPLGKPVIDTSKSALTSGAVGLYVEDEGSEVAFSNLYIQPL